MGAQGDFFSVLPLLFDAGALPFREEGLFQIIYTVKLTAQSMPNPNNCGGKHITHYE